MNKMKYVLLLAASLGLASCGSSTEKSEEGAKDSSAATTNDGAGQPADHVDGGGSDMSSNGGTTPADKVETPFEDKTGKVETPVEDPKKLDPKKEEPKKLDPKKEEPKKLKVN